MKYIYTMYRVAQKTAHQHFSKPIRHIDDISSILVVAKLVRYLWKTRRKCYLFLHQNSPKRTWPFCLNWVNWCCTKHRVRTDIQVLFSRTCKDQIPGFSMTQKSFFLGLSIENIDCTRSKSAYAKSIISVSALKWRSGNATPEVWPKRWHCIKSIAYAYLLNYYSKQK